MENEDNEKIEYVNEEPVSPGINGQETAEQRIKKLRRFLLHCKKTRAEYLEGWQRARAEFQNYIKQTAKDTQDFRKFASERVILQMIPVLDNLILACDSIPESIAENNWVKGIEQIRKQFKIALAENGVEEIAARPGDAFNPVYHESVGVAESGGKSGTIAEVLQRGYALQGKVVQTAKIKIAK